jgi:hypothetical protein
MSQEHIEIRRVIVVEHDPDVIKVADYVVDVGPLSTLGRKERVTWAPTR